MNEGKVVDFLRIKEIAHTLNGKKIVEVLILKFLVFVGPQFDKRLVVFVHLTY